MPPMIISPPGPRTATKVVAASNALSQFGADYVCDGTADDVEINAAIAALPAGGGKVELSEGTFDIVNPVLMNVDNLVLTGQGHRTSIIKLPATGAITGIVA